MITMLGRATRMQIPQFSVLVVALTLVSCRYPNEFKNTPANAPHAVLRGTRYPNGGHVFAFHINGQPTSFWRSSDTFRIPAGTNTCSTVFSDGRETVGYKTEQIVATAGREYVIARKREPKVASPFTATPHPTTANAWLIHDRRDRVTIHETKPGGFGNLMADVPREDYVFGVPSSASAIVEYHRKNP
jgi:hypothetical protein